jgi:hypothetical protein
MSSSVFSILGAAVAFKRGLLHLFVETRRKRWPVTVVRVVEGNARLSTVCLEKSTTTKPRTIFGYSMTGIYSRFC